MEEVRLLLREDGREARNLLAFHVSVNKGKMFRKPPVALESPEVKRRLSTDLCTGRKMVRSASTGRDKKSELRARYWALLFGNLQRAINEIYNTAETHESIAECEEAILVMENYIRDFRSLSEWFKLKWDYENTAPPQRPTSLTWEVRKASLPTNTSSGSSSPIPSYRSSNSPQNKSSSPQPIQEIEERVKEVPEIIALKKETTVLSPSEDQKTWLNVIKRNVSSAEVGTTTEDIEPQFKLPLRKPVKISQAIQTDEEESLKKVEPKRIPIRPAYSSAVTRCVKPPVKPPIKVVPKPPVKVPPMKPRPIVKRTSDIPTSTLLRSRTSTDIKTKEPPRGNTLIKQRSSVNIKAPTPRVPLQRVPPNRNPPLRKVQTVVKPPIPKHDDSDKESMNSSVETIVNAGVRPNEPPKPSVDGWLTVKCRSRFKTASKKTSHWANRFNEISATTSLPALALLQESDNETPEPPPKNTSAKTQYLKRTNTVLSKSSLRNHKSKSEEPTLPPKLDLEAVKNVADDDFEKNESQDEEEHFRKTQQLTDEEAMLTQEIEELQSFSVDVDTETDGTETDGEIGDDEEEVPPVKNDAMSLEARYEPVLAGLSWSERMDTLAALEDLVARHPGRALQLHQKLSNPERRRSLPETLRRYQVKHARAQQRRQALLQERAIRLQALLARVQDVKTAKNQLIEEKRLRMENRLQRAQLNRSQHLKSVIRKAHDEEEKLREIAFIKELEAQNKRHDFLELCKEQKGRLEDLREGQRKKIEEQAARGAAVEERRKALEQARHDRLERLQAERELRAERVGRRQLEIQEQARERARGREERLSALHAQQLASTRELQKRISQKQEESARRHEENMEQIRQKALELSILRSHNDEPHTPALTPYEAQKMCTVCNVHISSEVYLLSHLRGRAHQEAISLATGPLVGDQLERYELAHIVDAPIDDNHPRLIAARERVKILRKRCKKVRQRMTSKGSVFETEYKPPQVNNQNKRNLSKSAQKFLSLINQGWASATYNQLDRVLGETYRLLLKNNPADILAFQAAGWFSALSKLLMLGVESTCTIPVKSLVSACNVWQAACMNGANSASNCSYSILSNRILVVLDLLNCRLNGLAKDHQLPADPLATATMQLLATVLRNVPDDTPSMRVQDVVSYAVCVGIVEQLAQCCVSVRGPVHNDENTCSFLLAALELLTGLARRCGPPPPETHVPNGQALTNGNIVPSNKKNGEKNTRSSSLNSTSSTVNGGIDPTHFTAALHATELVGVVSMLYGTLLPTGASPRCEGNLPDALPTPCLSLATAVFRLLRQVAELDLRRFQEALGAEGVSLQFRHIVGHLLWSCASPPSGSGDAENAALELLHEVIAVVGYFAIKHDDNQMLLISGYAPTVLQQLCSLPFEYFSVPKMSEILYPTLLGCCYDNPRTRQILEQELSYELLSNFMKSESGRNHPLVKILQPDK